MARIQKDSESEFDAIQQVKHDKGNKDDNCYVLRQEQQFPLSNASESTTI